MKLKQDTEFSESDMASYPSWEVATQYSLTNADVLELCLNVDRLLTSVEVGHVELREAVEHVAAQGEVLVVVVDPIHELWHEITCPADDKALKERRNLIYAQFNTCTSITGIK